MILRTERLQIRAMQASDASALHELERLEVVNRYQAYDPMTLESAVRYASEAEESWAGLPFPTWQEFSVIYLNEFIGRIGFELQNNIAKTWFAFMPKVHGQGFATEALRELIRYLKHHGVRELLADCAVPNVASGALLLRTGFSEVASDDPELRHFRLSLIA